MTKKPIRVLHLLMGAERPLGGCEIYRSSMPMHHLQTHGDGWETGWVFINTLLQDLRLHGKPVIEDLMSADIVVFPRAIIPEGQAQEGLAVLFAAFRQSGTRIIYEVDDDYTNEYRFVAPGDALTPLKWADAVTVTTPYLAQRLRRFTKQPIHILPNCVDPAIWRDAPLNTERIKPDAVVIGLTGSPTHEGDWKVLETVIPEILASHPNAHFVVMGYHPDYLAGHERTSYLPGTNYVDYSHIIRSCDIILAPVDPEDRFNLGKSGIKATEGQAARRTLPGGRVAGAAVVATNNPVYSLVIKHNTTGLLTEHTPEAWAAALHRLIADTELREAIQINAHKWVYKHHDISVEHAQWSRAYRKVLAAHSSPVSIPLALMKGSSHGQ